jgi:hypothetical protein
MHTNIPQDGRLRQEDCKFEVSLDYIARPYLKKQRKKMVKEEPPIWNSAWSKVILLKVKEN